VPKHKLGRGVSGNPARRTESAAIAQRIGLAHDMWPFAFDFYTQQHRVGLYADVPVIDGDGGQKVDLHGTLSMPLGGLGQRVDIDRFTLAATVGDRRGGVHLVCSGAPDFDVALEEILGDITSLFLDELGGDVKPYVQSALQERPVLGSPAAARDLLLPLIVHPGDTWHLSDEAGMANH
jgi:hypothetical protein